MSIDGFIEDYLNVVYHVITNPHMDYFPTDSAGNCESATIAAIAESAARRTFPSPDVITEIVAWVCHNLTTKSLTPDETRVLASALRLSDAIHGRRVTYQPRFVSTRSH